MPELVGAANNLAFGAGAQSWARRLPASLPLLSTDLQSLPAAFAQAATYRKAGRRFAAAVFIDDPRAQFALFHGGPPVLAQLAGYDERVALLEAIAQGGLVLGGRDQRDVERYDTRFLRSAHEFLATADVVAVRSSVERERLCVLLGRRFMDTVAIAPHDPDVPAPARSRSDAQAIVVWAPMYPAEACGVYAFALEEFRRPAIIVCGAGKPPAMRPGTRFVAVHEAKDALLQAAVIVDASVGDPGTSRALARWGIPLAASTCSGAVDWLDAVTTFDPWNYRSIAAAVANALGNRPPRERATFDEVDELRRALGHANPARMSDGPLVSVIVPTMNRRASLRTALASIDAQTYSQLEIVLVNDGGPPIDVAVHATSRKLSVVEYPDNRGVSAAVNAGIAEARGKYIAILADDDVFCPDHLAQLVPPLERTHADFAHSIELGEHFEQQSDGHFAPIGHSLIAGEPAMPSVLQAFNVIGGPAILFTRSAYDRVGPFDERAGHLMDLDMWMRMSTAFDFIHVDRVTAVMTMRDDDSQASAVSGPQTAAFYREIYKLHPTTRPIVAERRERHLREVEAIDIVRTRPQLRFITLEADGRG